MTVFILMRGEDQEGGRIVAVKATREAAEALVPLQPSLDSGGDEWKKVDDTRWERGCDWLEIEEHTVDDPDRLLRLRNAMEVVTSLYALTKDAETKRMCWRAMQIADGAAKL